MKRNTRSRWLRSAVCLALVGVSCVYVSSEALAKQDVKKGNTANGYSAVNGLDDSSVVSYNEATNVASVSGVNITVGDIAPRDDNGVPGAVVQARVDNKTTPAIPVLNLTAENTFTAKSDATTIAGQDGTVNITGKTVNLETTFTSAATKGSKTEAAALSNIAWAAVYARNIFNDEAGQVNISGDNISILSAEQTLTDASLSNVKYGIAISGNGNGSINVHGKETVIIKGAIESLNTMMQKSETTGIKVNINQDAADTAKVEMEGLFINAADKSEVNIKGARGSSIKTDLIASASTKEAGKGGKINIALAGDSTFEGSITAQNYGSIVLSAADITGNVNATTKGTINLAGGAKTLTGAVTLDDAEFTASNTTINYDAPTVDSNVAVSVADGGKATFDGAQTNIIVDSQLNDKVYGVLLQTGAEANFNATDTVIDVKGIGKGSKWGYGLDAKNDTAANFNGTNATISDYQRDYTAQTLTVRDGAEVNFNTVGTTKIEASSPYGATTAVVTTGGVLNFNAGDVVINASLTGANKEGRANDVGLMVWSTGAQTELNVKSNVRSLTVNIDGQGYDDDLNTSNSNGTAALNVAGSGAVLNIDAQKFNVEVNYSGTSSNDGHHNVANGLFVDEEGKIQVGSGTNTMINVTRDTPSAAYVHGVYARNENSLVSLLGNTTITAKGNGTLDALFADEAGQIIVGSSGKTVKLTGDVVANNGGKITLGGTTNTVVGNAVSSGSNSSITLGGVSNTVTNVKALEANGYGAINVTAGKVYAEAAKTNEGTITVSGGCLEAKAYEANTNKSIVVTSSGSLRVTSGQVFANAYASGVTESGNQKDGFDLTGGSLLLTDEAMSLTYLKNIKDNVQEGSTTKISYTGTAISDVTVTDNTVKIDDLSGVGVTLTAIAGTTENSALTVGGTASAGTMATGDLGLKNVDLGTASDVTVTNGATLTLVGGTEGSGDLVKTTAAEGAKLDLTSGTLNLGVVGAAGGGTIKGTVTLDNTSSLNTNGGEFTVAGELKTSGTVNVGTGSKLTAETVKVEAGDVHVGGDLNANALTVTGTGTNVNVAGSLKVGQVDMSAGGNLNVAGQAAVTTLVGSSDTAISVGNENSAGHLVVRAAQLKGGSIFLDPAWLNGVEQNIADASHAALTFANETVDGALVVGRNSIATLGSDDTTWGDEAFAKANLTWGDQAGNVGAALALAKPQTLDSTGSITVNGTLLAPGTPTANTATFAADSALIVNAAAMGSSAALTGTTGSVLSVVSGARVVLDNAKADVNGQNISLVAGFDTGMDTAGNWSVLTTDRMLNTSVASVNATGFVQGITVNDVASVLPGVVVPNVVKGIYQNSLNDVSSTNAGIAFISQAANTNYVAEQAVAVEAVNSAAAMTVAGGQQNSTLNAAKLFTGSIQRHIAEDPQDRHIWAEYNHTNSKVRDINLGSGKLGFDNKLNGITLGVDLVATEHKHTGVAFTYGEGKVTSAQNVATTQNEYKYWGLDLYHGWHTAKADILADIGYLKNDGEIWQSNVLGKLKSDPTSNIWTAGVRADFKTKGDFTPYAGLRYLRLKTDSHNVNSPAGTVFNVGKDTQNIWLLPVGVSFSKKLQRGSGILVPKVDLGVLFAFGDKDTKASISVPGISGSDNLGLTVTDGTSFVGSLGLAYKTKRASYGLAYQLQAGSKEVRNGLWANAEFKF